MSGGVEIQRRHDSSRKSVTPLQDWRKFLEDLEREDVRFVATRYQLAEVADSTSTGRTTPDVVIEREIVRHRAYSDKDAVTLNDLAGLDHVLHVAGVQAKHLANHGLPPVKPGFVRLFRAERSLMRPLTSLDYLGHTPGDTVTGRFFTPNLPLAMMYTRPENAPLGADIFWVDIPQEIEEQSRITAMPDEIAQLATEMAIHYERFVPEEWAQKARRIPRNAEHHAGRLAGQHLLFDGAFNFGYERLFTSADSGPIPLQLNLEYVSGAPVVKDGQLAPDKWMPRRRTLARRYAGATLIIPVNSREVIDVRVGAGLVNSTRFFA